ncbi:MAG: hypothetical protein KAJ15_06740 [Spirochaetes bacterium]|nr:hypothetical protein [Spirochaetota bacterium]
MSSDLLSKRSAEEHNRDPPYPLKDSRSEEEPKKEQEEDPVETLSVLNVVLRWLCWN